MGVIGSLAIYGEATHMVSGPAAWRGHEQIQQADACSRCWNVEVGQKLDTVAIDRQADFNYAIEMSCEVKVKPNSVGQITLLCTEK